MTHSPKSNFRVAMLQSEDDSGGWELADAILAECCETGDDGVRNESYAKMKAMRQEIAAKPRRRTVVRAGPKASESRLVFPPGRRRPGVSLDGHLEAGTPDVLDELINSAPNGAPSRANTFAGGSTHPREPSRTSRRPNAATR